MAQVSLGDMAQSFMLRRQNVALKADLQRYATELTTGRVSDTSARVSGDLVPLSGIDATLARLKGYGAVNAEAGLFAGAMQTALGVIDSVSSTLSSTLLTAAGGVMPARVDAAGHDAQQRLETVVSALNTRFGDRSIFAGVSTTQAATVDADTLMSALDTAVAGAVSAADVETAVNSWFDAPGGFAALGYTGGGPLAALQIAPGEEAAVDVTATDPAIRATLKGLALAALLDRGVLSGQPDARQDIARRAGVSLLQSQTDLAYLSARLGSTEAQISAAVARNSAESTSLQIARADIVAADPFETASRLEETQTQLEKIYAITARMTRLSLMDYL
jgi:flagellar hook-associated protein 3 FlgL